MSRHTSPYEVYAKYVLEAVYGGRYGTLLLRDKPDLQTADGEAGIEVTSVNGETFERLVTEIAMSCAQNAALSITHGRPLSSTLSLPPDSLSLSAKS